MDFYEEASLVMVPSGYKDQKVYSSVPDDGSADLTFSRASTATRINSDGYIEKAQVNLLLQSNSFDTTWTNSSTTETSGQSGYDGTNDAWKLTKSAINAYIRQDLTGSGVFTFSVYAKASTDGGDSDGIYMLINGSPDSWATFDLNNGTTSLGAGASVDSKIEVIGSGWYRCSLTGKGGVSDVRIYPTAEDGTYADTTGAVFIQDAQLNYGLVAQTYVETTTASVTEGVAIDVPRLTYDPVNPTSASLLLEPSRTNLVTQSEYFNGWFNFRNTLTANDSASPEGVSNAYSMIPETSNDTHFIYFNLTESAVSYSYSLFAKSNGLQWIQLAKGGGGYANFDLVNGVTGNYGVDITNSTIEDYGNGWYKLTAYYTSVGGASNVAISALSSNNTARYQTFAGDGVNGFYIYGAQLEAGSYPSSYIPTYGASATRTSESASKTGIGSLFGTSAGTIYFETTYYPETNTGQGERWVYAQGATSSDYIRLWQDVTGGSKRIRALVGTGGVQQVNISSLATELGLSDTEPRTIKFAFAYADNDFRMYVNGNKREDTAGTAPTITEINFNNTFQTLMPLAQALVFPTALSDTDLATLTA